LALAAAKFREAVEASVAPVPPASKHWDNKLLSVLQSIVSKVGLAVAEFKPFLRPSDQARLDAEWCSFKKHCEERIPQSLSVEEVLYGGGAPVAQEAKEQFHAHIRALLAHAQQT
jgi:sugar phosphate isomerase/epimerase